MLHILRLHAGWLSYCSKESLRLLFNILPDEVYIETGHVHRSVHGRVGIGQGGEDGRTESESVRTTASSFRSFRSRYSIRSNDDDEEVQRTTTFAEENSKKSIYYRLLCPNTRSLIKDKITTELEIESPAYWRLQYRKELFIWVQDMTYMVLDQLTAMDRVGGEEDKRREIMEYINMEYELKVALLSHFDDEMYEAMHIRDNQQILEETQIPENKKLADYVKEAYSKYTSSFLQARERGEGEGGEGKRKHVSQNTNEHESKKILDIMNWRSFEVVGEVGSCIWNLILGLRLLIRVRQGVTTLRPPMLPIDDILYFMYLTDEHRLGSYFPTCFNGYSMGSQGLHVNNGIYMYLRDVLLDELALHIYNQELLEKWENGGVNNIMSSQSTNNNTTQDTEDRWNEFLNTHVGNLGRSNVQMDGEAVLEDEEDQEDLEIGVYGEEGQEEREEEENGRERRIPKSYINQHKRYKKVPNRMIVDGKVYKAVLKTPPEGNMSKISKRIEMHENLLVKYNIRKIKESMIIMQEEHNMEMRLRKVKGAYQIPDKTPVQGGVEEEDNIIIQMKRKHVKVHDNMYGAEDGEEGYDISDDLIEYFEKMGVRKANLQTSIQNIIQDFPVPEKMRTFLENKDEGVKDTLKLQLPESASYLRDFCLRAMNNHESSNDFDNTGKKKEEMEKNHQEVYEEFVGKIKKRDMLKECFHIGVNMLGYHNIQYTYLNRFPEITLKMWSNIQMKLHFFFLVNGVRANETQMVIDAHDWIALYIKNRPWKRETYKRSGIAKPSSLGIESWRFAESEFSIRNFTHVNLFEPLLPLLETYYPNVAFINMLKTSQGKRPITEHLYLGTYLMGYYHTILKTMSDKEINGLKIGIFLDPRFDHPYQNDILAYVVYWWFQQQLRQSDIDVNRSVFYWELESKYYNIYRGEILNPVITRVGGDWCVFDGCNNGHEAERYCDWTRPGTNSLYLINCGDNILRAVYTWMKCMEKVNWHLEQRDPSLRVWNECISLNTKDKSADHRRSGKIVNLMGTPIYEAYVITRDTQETSVV